MHVSLVSGLVRYRKQIDVLVLLLLAVGSVAISLMLHAPYILSTLFFFGFPALYLSIRSPKLVKKTLVYSAIIGIPVSIVPNYVAVFNESWATNSIFSVYIFSKVPVDDLMWGFGITYLITIFYQHFFNNNASLHLSKNFRHLATGLAGMMLIFVLVYFTNQELFRIPYYYLFSGIVLILTPTLITILLHPDSIIIFTRAAAFFCTLMLLFEWTALELHQWSFPGTEFIGWVELLGHRFPLEEFIFFMLFIAPAVMSFIILFDDTQKKRITV